jgi:putative intracellular protease/amidase
MQFTGFSNTEEEAVGKTESIPWLLQDKLSERGGLYSKGNKDWTPFVIVDGNLITGQNPQSSELVAEKVIAALG